MTRGSDSAGLLAPFDIDVNCSVCDYMQIRKPTKFRRLASTRNRCRESRARLHRTEQPSPLSFYLTGEVKEAFVFGFAAWSPRKFVRVS